MQAQHVTVNPNTELRPGALIETPNKKYHLHFQKDGNLVLYKRTFDARGRIPYWDTQTHGVPPSKLTMQGDGNFVLYSPEKAVWATGTHGNLGSKLQIQDDGNLVIVNSSGHAIWSSGTVLAVRYHQLSQQERDAMHQEALKIIHNHVPANDRDRAVNELNNTIHSMEQTNPLVSTSPQERSEEIGAGVLYTIGLSIAEEFVKSLGKDVGEYLISVGDDFRKWGKDLGPVGEVLKGAGYGVEIIGNGLKKIGDKL